MQPLATAVLAKTLLQVVQRLGGPGLILLGLIDNSIIPLPGGMDAATILLAATHHEPWWYYAIMATIGSLIGGYLTYRIGMRGGEEILQKKLSKRRVEQVYRVFRRFGFWYVSLTALAPPPTPTVPMLMAAGALEYPRRKFLGALALGRVVRYTLLAYLGHLYGRSILQWLTRYYRPLLYSLIGLAVVGALVGLYLWRQRRKDKDPEKSARVRKVA
jgi:membrane protein YqaA with SNARE-associated domain